MRTSRSLVVAIALMMLRVGGAAEINGSVVPGEERYTILFFNQIQRGDLEELKRQYAKSPYPRSTWLAIGSPGGDLDEAMAIGEFLQRNDISVMVPVLPNRETRTYSHLQCYSSCILILAGGYQKSVVGSVGIHRPYIADLNIRGEAVPTVLARAKRNVANYLDRMGISVQLAEDMFSTPPEKMRVLTREEIQRYRLDQVNYVKAEQEDLEMARTFGWTRQELMRRKARITAECTRYAGNEAATMKCIDQIVHEK